ncbi:DUF5947 family protein [Haloactinomyces albus]|uniref:Uncharacterized protein n=1 Tax=Haloactinomyces albus TaxID=1352928 RepID=A0AAE3ZAI2_9ACTN|nr:DUF5947 family protein [Haloactinomyces albus]MDR7300046.1 hypothetical protein [Haloactinomyces albus]
MPSPLATSRLRQFAQRPVTSVRGSSAESSEEHCDLCAEPMPTATHRHLLDVSTGTVSCACRACGILFDHQAAGGGHYRLIRSRPRRLDEFDLDDVMWASLGIPVGLAFLVHSSAADQVTAFYPNPMGMMQSVLEAETWQEITASNPVLSGMDSDVEALLINRLGEARQHWLLPVDDCYRLVALVRTHWKGFTGGTEVWQHVERFFEDLPQ